MSDNDTVIQKNLMTKLYY